MRVASVNRRLQWRVRLGRWLPEKQWRETLAWAAVAGAVSALCVGGFRGAVELLQSILTQGSGGLIEVARGLPLWQRLATPALGGVLAGLVIQFGLGWVGRANPTDYMEALSVGDGVIRFRPALLRSGASLFTIGSGGSIGREGAMVQLAAAAVSALGRLFRLRVPQLPLLVACGAAGAVASAYNAPIAGALFIAEIVLGSIAMESFGALLMASVVSVLFTRYWYGSAPLFGPHVFGLVSPAEILLYLLLGIIIGGLAPGWMYLLRAAEVGFTRLALPLPARLGLGGLVVGSISLLVPEVWGNGYEHVREILAGEAARGPMVILLLLGAKALATTASFGSGAVGGVLTPTLLIGGLGGLAWGQIVHGLFPGSTGSPQAYALVGMGCCLTATIRAPLTAMLLVFEMTLDYDIMLSLIVGSVSAYYVARGIAPDSIYARSLRRRETVTPEGFAARARVREVMRPPPPAVASSATFDEIANRFSESRETHVAVVDGESALVGSVLLPSIERFLRDPMLARLVTAGDVMVPEPAPVLAEQRLGEALERFRSCPGEFLLVVDDREHRRVVGSLAKTDVILCLAHGSRFRAEATSG